jgi:hypothetical protein
MNLKGRVTEWLLQGSDSGESVKEALERIADPYVQGCRQGEVEEAKEAPLWMQQCKSQ